MIWLVADSLPMPVVAWMMLSLIALLLCGILVAWLLGRLFGSRSNWGKPLVDPDKKKKPDPTLDAWQESARRLRDERDDQNQAS